MHRNNHAVVVSIREFRYCSLPLIRTAEISLLRVEVGAIWKSLVY